MTNEPHSARVATALALALATALGMAPASASHAPQVGLSSVEPGATKAVAPCDGPGRMALTVHPLTAGGTYPVEVRATRLADGSRWQGRVQWEEAGQVQEFRRVAVDGRWSFTTHMPESEGDQPDMHVSTYGGDGGWCSVGVVPGPTPVASAGCSNGLDSLGVRALEDGTYAVVSAVLGVAPSKTKWRLRVEVRGDGSGQSVTFDDYSNRYAELVNVVTLTDLPTDPRFVLEAESRENGAQCRLRLNPAPLTPPSSEPADPRPLRLPGSSRHQARLGHTSASETLDSRAPQAGGR